MPFVIEIENDPLFTKGREKGRIEGRLEGKMEEKRAIAISLLDILNDEMIAKRVGLDINEVRKLREENNISFK